MKKVLVWTMRQTVSERTVGRLLTCRLRLRLGAPAMWFVCKTSLTRRKKDSEEVENSTEYNKGLFVTADCRSIKTHLSFMNQEVPR